MATRLTGSFVTSGSLGGTGSIKGRLERVPCISGVLEVFLNQVFTQLLMNISHSNVRWGWGVQRGGSVTGN